MRMRSCWIVWRKSATALWLLQADARVHSAGIYRGHECDRAPLEAAAKQSRNELILIAAAERVD